jgi:hypothetical protein
LFYKASLKLKKHFSLYFTHLISFFMYFFAPFFCLLVLLAGRAPNRLYLQATHAFFLFFLQSNSDKRIKQPLYLYVLASLSAVGFLSCLLSLANACLPLRGKRASISNFRQQARDRSAVGFLSMLAYLDKQA